MRSSGIIRSPYGWSALGSFGWDGQIDEVVVECVSAVVDAIAGVLVGFDDDGLPSSSVSAHSARALQRRCRITGDAAHDDRAASLPVMSARGSFASGKNVHA
jgi:hypothetical protein